MKFCVTCVYWTLLVISVVSSGVLFLIVASESTQSGFEPPASDKDESADAYDNVTLDDQDNENLELSQESVAESQNLMPLKSYHKNQYPQDEDSVSASFETFLGEEVQKEKELETLAENFAQQSNLSQGISETGQAVVLTLVDTAAAELQSLTEPRVNPDFRTRPKNSTVPTSTVPSTRSEKIQELTQSTQIPAPPIFDETTERPNDTEHFSENENDDSVDDEKVIVVRKSVVGEEVPEIVVVVRAEQKVTDGSELRLSEHDVEAEDVEAEEVEEEEEEEELVPKIDDAFAAVPELNDTAARASLAVAGNRDEAAAVILDGLVASGSTDPHEDIPSFSEWAQKRLEEAEKKKTHPNASVQSPGGPGSRGVGGMKVRSKNYASPDCGAKIVAVNPEARSAKSVLASTRDEYMLNTCTSRVWFVVELCEAIQAKKIELANFELFSSSPKDFSVYVSDRLSTRDWSAVGHFTAKDEKDIQSFTLHPHLFGKFIKVELHSHYGSEHFCPISLFRAYGTSEFEVLETETETENQAAREATSDAETEDSDDEEEVLDVESGEPPRNLFGSATDAVLSIVKKAAEVLVKSSDIAQNNITKIQRSIGGVDVLENSYDGCITPRYTIICDNCSDQKFAEVFQLVSCRNRQLDELLRNDLVNETLACGGLCQFHGVDVGVDGEAKESKVEGGYASLMYLRRNFLSSFFKPEYIVGLCNVLATRERKVVMNTSYELVPGTNDSDTVLTKEAVDDKTVEDNEVTQQFTAARTTDSTSTTSKTTSTLRESRRRGQESLEETSTTSQQTTIEPPSSSESLAAQIKPTKTLSKEDLKRESSLPTLEPSKEFAEENFRAEVLTTLAPSSSVATPTLKIVEEPPILGTSVETTPRTVTSVPMVNSESQERDSALPTDADSVEVVRVDSKPEAATDPEIKGRAEFGEQEGKIPQDPIAFDSLLSDLKDLDSDAVNLQNGQANSASTTQPTATTTPQQKESVFLRLSNRIKALERNMSLSGQYLEELSRRYKKQVEEMQRSLERAVSAMGEESRRGEERETKRMEEIAVLREKIATLSKSVESLLYDRDSWRSRISAIGQHALLICLEVVIVIVILSYCRRAGDFEDEEEERSTTRKETVRRKSMENFSGNTAKKVKKRRPSEIASHISGSYRELMIDDKYDTRKERKKKRKKESGLKVTVSEDAKKDTVTRCKGVLNITGATSLPPRRASSVDAPAASDFQQHTHHSRPDSAPETTTIGWFDDQTSDKERHNRHGREFEARVSIVELSRQMDEMSESNSSSTTMDRSAGGSVDDGGRVTDPAKRSGYRSGILKTARLSSPSFMKTALGSRRRRKASSDSFRTEEVELSCHTSQTTESSHRYDAASEKSNANGGTAANGLMDESDESRSSSATPSSGKKEKRSTGLKKMVRKLF